MPIDRTCCFDFRDQNVIPFSLTYFPLSAAIVGSRYIDLVKSYKPDQFTWHLKASEHSFEFRDINGVHKVFYPSLRVCVECIP